MDASSNFRETGHRTNVREFDPFCLPVGSKLTG